jgi:trk system potassium uptake protein TrkH
MQYRAIQRAAGGVIGLASAVSLLPLALGLYDRDGTAFAFLASFALTGGFGLILWLSAGPVQADLRLREGFLITSLSWILVSASSALPFMLAAPYLGLADAMFEATSGITTTGATVITGLDALPRSMQLYRQLLCFVGGMGIVILAVAVLPMLRVGGMQLFRAESTGPIKDTKLTPRVAETAKALWRVYLGLNILCALAFWLAGMSLFDAIGHAFSTVATAGFSTHDASFAYWDSALIDAIAVLFMLLGATNFGLHYVAWRRATVSVYGGDSELRTFISIVLAATIAVWLPLLFGGAFEGPLAALRHALFQTVSNITTTGYVTTGFVAWPAYVPLLLLLIGFVGGSSGSTSGGMKVARVQMAVRQGVRELRQLVHPRGKFLVKMGGRRVSESIVLSVGGFCTLYVLSFVALTLLLASTGVDPVTAFAAVAACLNNMGPGLGEVAMTFQTIGDAGVWICTFAMILGRLEVFALLVLFLPSFWRE